MPLKASLTAEAYTALSETQKEFYIQAGENYILDAEGVEDVTGLKNALGAERKIREKAEKDYLETVNRYKDIDPVKAAEALKALEEIERQKLEAAQEWETLKAKAIEERETAVNTVKTDLTGKLTKREEKLREVLIDNTLQAELAKQGVKAKSIELATKLFKEHVDLALDGDDITVSIKGDKGANISELVSNLKNTEEYGVLFDAFVPAGSGTPNGKTGSQPAQGKKKSEMSDTEQAAYIREYGYSTRKNAAVPSLSELKN
jgi:hypothetical protein